MHQVLCKNVIYEHHSGQQGYRKQGKSSGDGFEQQVFEYLQRGQRPDQRVKVVAPEEMVDVEIERKLIRSSAIVDALIEESGRHSLTFIGASNQGVWEQLRLGSVPEMVSRSSSKSVVIVRKYEGTIKSWVRRFFAG